MKFLVLAVCYLIGGIPFGYLLVRWRTGEDVRTSGSGNIGATNVLRTSGRGLGVATLALDIAKGWFAVWLMGQVAPGDLFWLSLAALAVIAGHAFPAFLRFQGGKAVASFIGAFLYLSPGPLLAVLVVFTAVVWATRFISLGSIVAAGSFPLAVFLMQHPEWPLLAAAAVAGTFVVWRHRANLARLRAGTENVFTFRKRK